MLISKSIVIDSAVVNNIRLPTPPEVTRLDCSPSRNSSTTSGALMDMDMDSPLQERGSQPSPRDSHHSALHGFVGLSNSDITALESGLHVSDIPMIPSPTATTSTNQEGTGATIDVLHVGTYSTLTSDRSSTADMAATDAQQAMPDLDGWHSSDVMWTDADHINAGEFVSNPSNIAPVSNMVQDSSKENYFDDIDILSIMPRNNIDFEADFSSYLFHSGYSPSDRQDATAKVHEHSPRSHNSTAGMSHACAVPIHAKAVAFSMSPERGTFSRMPSLMKETPQKIPAVLVDEETYQNIVADVKSRLTPEQFEDMDMLSSHDMQRFLASYLNCFHRHCPIIHIPSLDLKTTPSHLIFAICAIGALYRLSRKTAKDLWYWADYMVDKVFTRACLDIVNKDVANRGQQSTTTSPDLLSRSSTAAVQCRMLLGMFAIFSGDQTERAVSRAGYWSTVCRRHFLHVRSWSHDRNHGQSRHRS